MQHPSEHERTRSGDRLCRRRVFSPLWDCSSCRLAGRAGLDQAGTQNSLDIHVSHGWELARLCQTAASATYVKTGTGNRPNQAKPQFHLAHRRARTSCRLHLLDWTAHQPIGELRLCEGHAQARLKYHPAYARYSAGNRPGTETLGTPLVGCSSH